MTGQKLFQADKNLLAAQLGSRNNSLDLLRFLAASLVILGHSHAITGSGTDPMQAWNGSVYSGSFALHIFFFLSGLLVTHSYLQRPDIVHWLGARVLRILPALGLCLVLTVFVLGPLTSTLPLKRYFAAHEVWDYLVGNFLLLRTRYFLPGVFSRNVEKAVNGPLWSLYLEVRLYLCAAVLLWTFRKWRREWITFALFAIVLVALAAPQWTFVFRESPENSTCSALFLLGALGALWSDRIVISNLWLVVLLLAANQYVYTVAFAPLFFFFTCYLVLCFGYSRWLSNIHLPGDYSYGVYIYGWPVQQLAAEHFPHWSATENAVASMAGAVGLAMLSWHFVEKRSLAQKHKINAAAVMKKGILIPLGSAAIIVISLYAYASRPVEGLGSIVAFGPSNLVAGQRFNVQPDGLSALWVQLSSSASAESCIVFRGHQLRSATAGPIVTGTVPDDLFADSGEADIYVLDESYLPPKRSSVVRLTIKSRAR